MLRDSIPQKMNPNKSISEKSFSLAVQYKVALVALENVNAGNVVGLALVNNRIRRRYVGFVANLKQNGFFRLRRHSVNLISGKLPEIRLYCRNRDKLLFMVPVFVRDILAFLYLYTFVFQLHSGYRCSIFVVMLI